MPRLESLRKSSRMRRTAVKETHTPSVPVDAVGAPLRVHLEQRVIALKGSESSQVDQGSVVATEAFDDVNVRLGCATADVVLQPLGASANKGDEQVVVLGSRANRSSM